MPKAKLVEIKAVLDLRSEAPIAGELSDSGAEEGCVRVLAGFGLAGAWFGPGEGRSEVVFAAVKRVLFYDDRTDFLTREEASNDEVAFACEKFAFAFEGAQFSRGAGAMLLRL